MPNLHDNRKTKMAAIVNKAYYGTKMGSKWRNKTRGLVLKFIKLICLLHINYRPFDPCEGVPLEKKLRKKSRIKLCLLFLFNFL